jgi:hypothetical protein
VHFYQQQKLAGVLSAAVQITLRSLTCRCSCKPAAQKRIGHTCLNAVPFLQAVFLQACSPSNLLWTRVYIAATQFQKQSGGGGIDNNINDSICEVLEGGAKPTGVTITD